MNITNLSISRFMNFPDIILYPVEIIQLRFIAYWNDNYISAKRISSTAGLAIIESKNCQCICADSFLFDLP